MKLSAIWPLVTRTASAEGVLRVGASTLHDSHLDVFGRWIEAGHHAGMTWLEKNVSVRERPESRFPWAHSAILITVPYSAERPAAESGALSQHIARYALGDDYHQVLDRVLRSLEGAIKRAEPDSKTWRYVDTGPLSDRSLAAQAGLGWIGKNGMLIDEEHGSYVFIGALLTSLENDISEAEVADRCGDCTRCIDACPTDAILPNRIVASEHCVSYLTIEHRGAFARTPELAGNVFGCDICQEVCPWNAAPAEPHPSFVARHEYRATPITDLLRFEQADFSRLFRNSAIKRAKLAGMQRNVEAVYSHHERQNAERRTQN